MLYMASVIITVSVSSKIDLAPGADGRREDKHVINMIRLSDKLVIHVTTYTCVHVGTTLVAELVFAALSGLLTHFGPSQSSKWDKSGRPSRDTSG